MSSVASILVPALWSDPDLMASLSSLGLPPELQNFVSTASEVFDQMRGDGEEHDRCNYEIYLDKPDADAAAAHASICEFVARHTQDYMWFRDAFILGAAEAQGGALVLQGSVRCGDCVDDEWFLTFLLLELSRAMPCLSCRIWDADGDFPLIEAAEHLPAWLDPANSKNRVWLRGGALHIIPLDEPGRLPCGGVQLARALECLRANPNPNPNRTECLRAASSFSRACPNPNTNPNSSPNPNPSFSRACPRVQASLAARTSQAYPGYALASQHSALCSLPAGVARLLERGTKGALRLVPAAVNALCLPELNAEPGRGRTAGSTHAFARLGPLLEGDAVCVPVRFTRALFARLTFKVKLGLGLGLD